VDAKEVEGKNGDFSVFFLSVVSFSFSVLVATTRSPFSSSSSSRRRRPSPFGPPLPLNSLSTPPSPTCLPFLHLTSLRLSQNGVLRQSQRQRPRARSLEQRIRPLLLLLRLHPSFRSSILTSLPSRGQLEEGSRDSDGYAGGHSCVLPLHGRRIRRVS